MTVQEKFEDMLFLMGLFPHQAKAIVARAMPIMQRLSKDYDIKWSNAADSYPAALYAMSFQVVKKVALKWIIENAPDAWFRPMFEKVKTV